MVCSICALVGVGAARVHAQSIQDALNKADVENELAVEDSNPMKISCDARIQQIRGMTSVKECVDKVIEQTFSSILGTFETPKDLGAGGTSKIFSSTMTSKTGKTTRTVAVKVGAEAHYFAAAKKSQDRALGDFELHSAWAEYGDYKKPEEAFRRAWQNEFKMQCEAASLPEKIAPKAFAAYECVSEITRKEAYCHGTRTDQQKCKDAKRACNSDYVELEEQEACCVYTSSKCTIGGKPPKAWGEFVEEPISGGFRINTNSRPTERVGVMVMMAKVANGRGWPTLRSALNELLQCLDLNDLATCLAKAPMAPMAECTIQDLLKQAFCAVNSLWQPARGQELWDLHLDNFLYDPRSCKINIIDFGAARVKDPKSLHFLWNQFDFVEELLSTSRGRNSTNRFQDSWVAELRDAGMLAAGAITPDSAVCDSLRSDVLARIAKIQ